MKYFFLLFMTLLFWQCGEDQSREAATQAALESPETAVKTKPGEKPALSTATVGTLSLSTSGKTTAKGSETCVAVTARDFRDIVSMQYTMQWDPNVLVFKEVRNFGLPGMSAQNFGTQLASRGLLTYSWFDLNVKGVSEADGVKLYDVCFDVQGESGSKSSIRFVNEPTVIEITNSDSHFLSLDAAAGQVEVR